MTTRMTIHRFDWCLLGLFFVVLLGAIFYLSRPTPPTKTLSEDFPVSHSTPVKIAAPALGTPSRAVADPDRPITRETSTRRPVLQTAVSREPQPNWPLVFRDTAGLSLTPDQQKLIADLQDAFAREVGERQDPYNPAYRLRWLKAQAAVDSQLRVALGSEVMNQLQIKGAQEDYQTQ